MGCAEQWKLLANEYVYYQRTVAKQALFQDENLARRLTDESLIYMYRLLFLLYAEARAGELDVVPVKAEAYMKGYSVEALRDLEQVPLTTPQAQNGYYIHESLNILFSLVDEGHNPQQLGFNIDNETPVTGYDDLRFQGEGIAQPAVQPSEHAALVVSQIPQQRFAGGHPAAFVITRKERPQSPARTHQLFPTWYQPAGGRCMKPCSVTVDSSPASDCTK